ncbi:MAG TPA: hypothetical protein VFP68_07655 [Burkholderiaceae bacterium]|nr:hypothetical protein [Burkholderiaceae bacterium]
MPVTSLGPFEPLARLMQSNLALLTDFWSSSRGWYLPRDSAQGGSMQLMPFAVDYESQSQAFARLFESLSDNYFRFVSESMQWGSAFQAGEQEAVTPLGGSSESQQESRPSVVSAPVVSVMPTEGRKRPSPRQRTRIE